jgi:hypothetical protein
MRKNCVGSKHLTFKPNHDGKRSDDLFEIGQVSKIIALAIDSVPKLTFVLPAVKVTDLPKFVAADSNAFSRAARAGVGSR